MRTLDRSLGALLLTGLAANAAAEEPSHRLVVDRTVDAADCPSSVELEARIAALRGRGASPLDAPYRVEFARASSTYTAVIRAADGSTRAIEARGDSCASLAQATTVTLALLLDAEPRARPELAPVPAAPAPARPSPPAQAEPARGAHAASDTELGLLLGGGALLGVVRPVAPVLSLEGGLTHGWFRVGLGGVWALPQSLSLGPGSVRERLFAGTARGCVALTRARVTRLDACTGLFAGAQQAEASGFTTNTARTRNWFAVPAELALSQRFGAFGWELGASALFPLVRNEFVVDGQGAAYSASAVAALFSLRAFGVVPW
jgi:hypothetical protein